jgi:hypothetical protein
MCNLPLPIHIDPLLIPSRPKALNSIPSNQRRDEITVVLKHMHYSVNPDDIKSEIEKLGHKVANIWNIKQLQTKLPLSKFFVDLKPAPNNKDIFDVEFLQ